jgi:hypothetical protein
VLRHLIVLSVVCVIILFHYSSQHHPYSSTVIVFQTFKQVWGFIRMFFLISIGLPLVIALAAAVFALWLPLMPIWVCIFFCNSPAPTSLHDFIKETVKITVYFYGGPVVFVLAIASVGVHAVLAAPLYIAAPVMVVYLRCKSEPTPGYEIKRMLYTLWRWYCLVLCIAVYAAPVLSVAAAAAASVLVLQIIALPRTIMMYASPFVKCFFVTLCLGTETCNPSTFCSTTAVLFLNCLFTSLARFPPY